jgi:diguanylate cyclase (GGDEF)-like protein
MYQLLTDTLLGLLPPLAFNCSTQLLELWLLGSTITCGLFALLATSPDLKQREPQLCEEGLDLLHLIEDFQLAQLLSEDTDYRDLARDLAERLQTLFRADSLFVYLFSQSCEAFQLFVSLGKPIRFQREIPSSTYSQIKKEAEPLLGSEAIFEISAVKLTAPEAKEKALDLLFVPLEAEGKSYGFIVSSLPQRGLSRRASKLAEWLGRALTLAFLLEDSRRQTSRLKENYRRVEIQKGELTHRLQQKIFELNSLFKSSNRLFAVHDERGLAESLLEVVKELLGAHFIGFCGCGPEVGETLSMLRGGGFEFSSSALPILTPASPLYGYLQEHREPASLPALIKIKPSETYILKLLELDFKAACGIYFGSQLYGLVLCGPKLDGRDYHHGDLEVLSILSNMASVALQNLRQFRLIEELSYTDSMTGLYNYRFFYKRLSEELTRAKRYLRKLSLVIFDLDEFKSYNDRYGHQIGDEILRQLSQYTKGIVRSIDVVCRYGGEEFCVIMPDTDREEVSRFVERLRDEIANHGFKIENLSHSPRITASVGAAVFPEDADTVDRLIYCADMALLEAKKKGRNLACLFTPQMVVSGEW